MSAVTWPFDSQVATSFRCSIVTKSLSPDVSEILASKSIGVTTLTSQGHVTSSVTWPFDSQVVISYRRSIVTKSLSPAIFEIIAPNISRLRDVIGQVTIGLAVVHFPLVVLWTQVSDSNGFQDIPPQTSRALWHSAKSSLRLRDITWYVPPR